MSLLLTLFVCLSFVPPEWIDLPQHATLTLVPSLATQSTTPYYTYTVIADLTNCDNVGRPVLNENGQVAFAARRDSPIGPQGGSVVIRRGDGSGPLVDIYTPGLSSSFTVPDTGISINDDGAIAFSGVSGSRSVILVGGGGPVNTVVDTAVDPQFKHVLRPSINNSGVVAFMAGTIVDKYDTVAVAHSGNIKTIVGPGFSTTGGVLTAATEPAINNKGVVAFRGQPFNLGFTHSGALLLATWSATSTFMASTILARWQTRGK